MNTKRTMAALAAVPIAALLAGGGMVLTQASAGQPAPSVTQNVAVHHTQDPVTGHDAILSRTTTVTVTLHPGEHATSSAVPQHASSAATDHHSGVAVTTRPNPTVTATRHHTDHPDQAAHAGGHTHTPGTAAAGEHDHGDDCGQ